jgi:glutamate-1-semialdehyde 2,1-aminomutase
MSVTTRSGIDALVADYRERNPRSAELAERAKKSLPGGNTRTGVWMDPFPPYIERASGAYIYDVDGHELLDFTFNNSSMIHGHAHPQVVEAIQRQVALGTGVNRPTELEIELAELLQARVPSVETVRFCNSGTEAVLNAIRAAIGFTGKSKIAKFEGAYHGVADMALVSLNPGLGPEIGPDDRPVALNSSVGLTRAADDVVVLPFNDLEAVEAIIAEHADQLAAVIVDPLMTSPGVITPIEGLLTGLRDVTKRYEVLLIFDEIISYRVSAAGMQGLAGVVPDLTTFGKIVAGGTPGGAFGGRADILALYDPTSGAKIQQSGTFNGNPISMIAGLVTLRLLTPAVYDRMAAFGAQVAGEISTLFQELGIPGSTAATGSLFRVYFREEPPQDYRDTLRDDKAMHRAMTLWLLNQGIHWHQGGYIASITEPGHLDRLVSEFRSGLQALSA